MTRCLRPAFAVAASLFLAACTFSEGLMGGACRSDAKEWLADADWDSAVPIDITIRDNEYEPMIIVMQKERRYFLRIRNRDRRPHLFIASDFFRDAPADMGPESPSSCLNHVWIAPGQLREMRVVTIEEGRYEFFDDYMDFLPSGDKGGVIVVE